MGAVFAVAGAVDTEAPVISLDLAGRVPYKLANRIEHTHATNHVGLPVGSYQDYSVRCAAGSMNHKECPSPTASAFDHHEGAIDVTTRIFMVNNNVAKSCLGGTPKNNGVVTEIDYNMRATYLFKYDATDASGNRAEQVVFALILDDLEAPNITYESTHADMPVLGDEQIIESSSEWSLTQSYVKIGALDNIDGDVSDNLKFKVEKLTKSGSSNLFVPMLNANDECTSNCYQSRNKAATVIDTTATCDTCKDSTQCDTPACVYRVTMKAKDCAGIYGHNGVDNVRTHSVTLEVRDTRKPVIHVLGKSPKTVECVSSFTGRYEEADYKGEYKNSCKADSQNDYCSEGAKIVDLLDTQVEHKNLPYTWTSTVDVGVVGDYTVEFNTKDTSGNAADPIKRTVHVIDTVKPTITNEHENVVDTLPPVITLTLKNKLIQTSDGSALGVNGEYNPAGRQGDSKHFHHSGKHHTQLLVSGNPFLDSASEDAHKSARPFLARQQKEFSGYMAEQSSTNGWIIAAAASAVAGVALMGYSMKSAAPITVPV